LLLVEKHHFTPDIEFLRNKAGVAPALDYTLRAFPNHHRALMSLINLVVREKKEQIYGMTWPIECYLRRARAWRPDDTMVQVIYGLFYMKMNKPQQAIEQLEEVKAVRGDDPNVYYNLGLAYIQVGNYDKALENAHRAYALHYPLPGLRNMLVKAGKWRDLDTVKRTAASGVEPKQ
jgi:predicted Zn-dependent protease